MAAEPYVFGFYRKSGNISGNFGQVDFELADRIEKYWTSFARKGDPNTDALPAWPEFDGSGRYIEFTQDGRIVVSSGGPRKPQCDLLREAMQQHTIEH